MISSASDVAGGGVSSQFSTPSTHVDSSLGGSGLSGLLHSGSTTADYKSLSGCASEWLQRKNRRKSEVKVICFDRATYSNLSIIFITVLLGR